MYFLECAEIGTLSFKHLLKNIEQLSGEVSHVLLDTNFILNISTYYYLENSPVKAFEIIKWGQSSYEGEDIFTLEECKLLILEKEYQKALDKLDKLWHPSSTLAFFERAIIAILTHDEVKAKKYIEDLTEKENLKEEVLIQLTFFLAVNHMKTFALECWDKISGNHKFTFDYALTKIALEYELGKFELAFMDCHSLLKKYKTNIAVCLYYASLSIILKKTRNIHWILPHLKKIHPTNTFLIQLEKQWERMI